MFNLFKKSKKRYTDVSPEEAKSLMADKNNIIIDVRSAAERAQGFIKGSRQANIMSGEFMDVAKQLDSARTYIIYCRSGQRSTRACKALSKLGFENLYNLKGGIVAWDHFISK